MSLSKLFARQKSATRDLVDGLEKLRVNNLVLRDQAEGLRRLPVDRKRAIAAVDAGIAALAGQYDDRHLIGGLTRPMDGHPHLALDRLPANMAPAFLAVVVPDLLRAALIERVDGFYADREDPPENQRAKLIAQLEAEIADLEAAEEGLIRQAERSGLPILRRADADPRAVLAADTSLPT